MARKTRTPAQKPWNENPLIMARVGLVYEMYLKRVSYQDMRKQLSVVVDQEGAQVYGDISYSTVRQDVRRALVTLHQEHVDFVKEQTEELVALRNLIIGKTIKAWEDLDALQDANVLKGHDKEGNEIYVTESPVSIARAKADLSRALSSTVSDLERLLGLRKERGGDVNIDKVQILRIEGQRALLEAPSEEE